MHGDGFAADPARLREAATLLNACGADVVDASAGARASLSAAGAAVGGARVSAALAAFEHELGARASDCAEALRAVGAGLTQSADDVEASDRFPAPGSASDGAIRGALG